VQVWNAVDTHARKSHTSIIHGKWAHEETIATASFATTYLIVKNLQEARRERARANAARQA
jgi:4-hydroxy-3-methylbut-2-enyl diphosphate reductase